jgi:hypothetical protein
MHLWDSGLDFWNLIFTDAANLTTLRRLHSVLQGVGGVRRSVVRVADVVGRGSLCLKGSLRSRLLWLHLGGCLQGVTGVSG